AIRLIKYRARQLVGKAGFRGYNRRDLEQELIIDLLQRLPKYNSEYAKRKTFIDRVVKHKIANLIEAQKAEVRDYRRCTFSLNDQIEGEDGEEIEKIEVFDQEAYLGRTGRLSLSSAEVRNLSIELNKVLKSLPPELRILCKRLETDTITEISRGIGIPRATLYGLIKKLRAILKEAGLREYL
ncbi:MAG: sigma-70 family RNA polymerase sigma factor, partial [Syntrophales bacterium]